MSEATAVPTTGPRASFGVRFVAWLIDAVILGVVGGVLFGVAGPKGGQGLGGLIGLGYLVYFEGSPSGQTIGKHLMKIRVVDAETGGPIGYGRAIVRYFARILSAIACLVGYFWMLWDDNKQTWHDKLATDVVVPTSAYPVEAWPG